MEEFESRQMIREEIEKLSPEGRAAMGIPESLSWEGMGVKAKVAGDKVASAVLIVGAALAIVYFLHQHEGKSAKASENTQAEVREVKEEIQSLTFVLTLSEEERKKLRLDMPSSLRARTRGRDQQ